MIILETGVGALMTLKKVTSKNEKGDLVADSYIILAR
jgi:hypothetical protein